MSRERLQKLMSRAGVASRRASEELIEAGRVEVNGERATLGDRADPERDRIEVDGEPLPSPAPKRYLLLNKPRGVITTVDDPEGRETVLDLVPARLRRALIPVGRLDYQSEGLLLLTTDGEWANLVAHPRYGCSKTYEVKVRGVPEASAIERLRGGVELENRRSGGGQRRRTAPARISLLRTTGPGRREGNSWWRVELREGRKRQIRRMFERIGHPVQKLRRVAIGPLADSGLEPGEWRHLDPREVDRLRREALGEGRRRRR